MGFFDEFGQPEKLKVSGKQSVRELLSKNISDQMAILNGELRLGVKGNEIRKWFNNGVFSPTVGAFGLFEGKVLRVKPGQEKEMLAKFSDAFEKGEFDTQLNALEVRREDALKRLASAARKPRSTIS